MPASSPLCIPRWPSSYPVCFGIGIGCYIATAVLLRILGPKVVVQRKLGMHVALGIVAREYAGYVQSLETSWVLRSVPTALLGCGGWRIEPQLIVAAGFVPLSAVFCRRGE